MQNVYVHALTSRNVFVIKWKHIVGTFSGTSITSQPSFSAIVLSTSRHHPRATSSLNSKSAFTTIESSQNVNLLALSFAHLRVTHHRLFPHTNTNSNDRCKDVYYLGIKTEGKEIMKRELTKGFLFFGSVQSVEVFLWSGTVDFTCLR